MRRAAWALLLLLLALSARSAHAGPPFACCYCTRQTMDNRALLCEAIPSTDIGDFQSECVAKGGDTFPCSAAGSPDVCPAVFAAADLICPQAAPAPVMHGVTAGALAALLAGLGVFAVRTRRRSLKA